MARTPDIQDLDPRVQQALAGLEADAAARGIKTHVASGYRTSEEQQMAWANYQAEQAGQALPYPEFGHVAMAARPGTSPHEKGLAFDLQADDPNRQAELESLGAAHGMSTIKGDPGHFQLGGVMASAVQPSSEGGQTQSYSPNQIFNSIFGQESSYGRNPRAGGNVLQIQPSTFAGYAQPGENINDRAANMRVGMRIVQDLYNKAGGDPARVAVGYFSGPGNIAPPGSPTPWKVDKADASGKTVSSYVKDVTGRLGIKPPEGGGGGAQPSGEVDIASLLNTPPPPMSQLADTLSSAADEGMGSSLAQGQAGGLQPNAADYSPAYRGDFSFASASPAPEDVAAPYAMHKEARKPSTLSDLFDIKTIGQPGLKQVSAPYGGYTTRLG